MSYDIIRKASLAQLLLWWNQSDSPPAGFGDEFLHEVAYSLPSGGSLGLAALRRSVQAEDVRQRTASLRALADPRFIDERILAALLDAFFSTDQTLKATALHGFMRLGRFVLQPSDVEPLLCCGDDRMATLAMCYLSRATPSALSQNSLAVCSCG